MIGGHDISFPVEAVAETMEGAVRLIVATWPAAIVENAETGEILARAFNGIRELPREVLVYKDPAARDSWTDNGAQPENANLMVHVLRGNDSVTIVVDEPTETKMNALIQSIREIAYQDIFWIRAHAA